MTLNARDILDPSPAIIARLIAEVSAETGVSQPNIRGRQRKRPIARARQLVMYRARMADISFSEIGRVMGRHHTTVMHDVEIMEHILKTAARRKAQGNG